MKLCGIDEAGRGPVIGPMVIAGAVFESDTDIASWGVKDSKLLSQKKREELFKKIKKEAMDHSIIIVTAQEIDSALESEDMNLNWLEADTTVKILKRLSPDKAILDCPSTNIRAYKKYVEDKLNMDIRVVAEHKADLNNPVVGAASILAKVTRDMEIEKLKKKYGDFGSGYPSDPVTKRFIAKDPDLPIYRRTWSTWKKAAAQKNQRTLDNFS